MENQPDPDNPTDLHFALENLPPAPFLANRPIRITELSKATNETV